MVIPLVNDGSLEAVEGFSLSLQLPAGQEGARLGSDSTANVSISSDDDGLLPACQAEREMLPLSSSLPSPPLPISPSPSPPPPLPLSLSVVSISFSSVAVRVSEGAGTVSLSLAKEGSSSLPVSVLVSSTDDTATSEPSAAQQAVMSCYVTI